MMSGNFPMSAAIARASSMLEAVPLLGTWGRGGPTLPARSDPPPHYPPPPHLEADADHGLLEQLAILGAVDGRQLGADQLHAVLVQHAGLWGVGWGWGRHWVNGLIAEAL
jgi:hypothetical protein